MFKRISSYLKWVEKSTDGKVRAKIEIHADCSGKITYREYQTKDLPKEFEKPHWFYSKSDLKTLLSNLGF